MTSTLEIQAYYPQDQSFTVEVRMGTATREIGEIICQQRQFFNTGKTRDVAFRIQQLKTLKQAIATHQIEIVQALKADLNKPEFETYLLEISVLLEIDHALKHLQAWVKPRPVATAIDQFPASAYVCPEPLGVVLIIAPWNYPFQLMVSPLVGAIAAGNCILLKPSELSLHTSRLMATLIKKIFDPSYITVVEGGVETSQALLAEKFDHLFFTGSTAIGKIVMTAAAKHLTPVTLELGGKSPCIVDADVQLEVAARRIVWGKFLNAGQTCVAPDYLLVDRRIKPALTTAIQATIEEFYGKDPSQNPNYGRIVSTRHWARLTDLLQSGHILTGGKTNLDDRYIAPTLLDQVSWDDPVMQEEIFGPILPVLEYGDLSEAIALVNAQPKPLALYFFSKNKALQQRVLRETSSGGVCINDTILHLAVSDLPFGGVGSSGIGSYHGKAGFDTFSHQKGILRKSFWLDLKWRYAPYKGKLGLIKKMMGL